MSPRPRASALATVSASTASREGIRWVEEDGRAKGLLIGRQAVTWVGHIVDEDEEVFVHHAKVDPQNPPPTQNRVVKSERGCFLPCAFDTTFPRVDVHHWEWYVPIDEDHHMYYVVQGADGATAESREAFLKDWQDHLAREVWDYPGTDPEGFNNFDALGRFAIHQAYAREDWWHRERMYGPDYVIIQWRKLVAKHALLMAVGFRYRRMRSSMLGAIERGRVPAVDFLNGEVVERGKKHGIATPKRDMEIIRTRLRRAEEHHAQMKGRDK